MATDLHKERLEAVIFRLEESGASSVLDLGCGSGFLLVHLAAIKQFTKLAGIDICSSSLREAHINLADEHGQLPPHITLAHSSFTEPEIEFKDFQAAVLLETIEHILPEHLSKVEKALFTHQTLQTVIITTPNQEYNVLYGKTDQMRRRPDHQFEWTRKKFEGWASGIGLRHGYNVSFSGVGWPHPLYGSPTQMAEFYL